jgi:CrcB protein
MEILYIGIGGFIGAVARYYLGNLAHDWLRIHNFPIGILIVNVLGCFLIGMLSGIIETKVLISEHLKSLLIIGLLGSFTTFSTFSNDTLRFITTGNFFYAILNIFLSIFVGLLFVWFGYLITESF